MNNLYEYLVDYQINESLVEILEHDETIDEGKIMNGIKKLWKWITRKNKKNKEKTQQSFSSDNYFDNVDSSSDSKKETEFEISEYSLSKLNNAIKSEMKNTKETIDKTKNKDIKILVATDKDRNQIAAILVYISGDKSPIAEKEEQFKNFAHIYSLEIAKEYREIGLGRKLIKSAKDKLLALSTSQSKGFTIDIRESNSKKLYEKIGFNKTFKDKDKDINIMYAKYEDIDTEH